MAVLAFLEFFVYRDTWMNYEYEVDKDYSRSEGNKCFRSVCVFGFVLTELPLISIYSKLRINVDITVAMRCQCKYTHYSTLSSG